MIFLKKFQRKKRNGVLCFVALTVFLYAYWWVMSNRVIQDFWDPQYVFKRERLEARMKEYPGHPLWLVMGSSRVQSGLRTDLLVDRMQKDDNYPLIFNFGLGGASTFREYICLKRLLKAGIKPQRVGIEILGASMSRDIFEMADAPQLLIRARPDEMYDYVVHSDNPGLFYETWSRSRWDPTFRYGMKVPNQTLTWRLIPLPGIGHLEKTPYDQWGWATEPPAPIDPDFYRAHFELAKGQFANKFEDFKISPKTDVPLRKMLEMCRDAGIDVFLFKMPEEKEFQALYTPEAEARIAEYLAQIEKEYGVSMIDARNWIGKEGFMDGHHLNADGAADFTQRFSDAVMKEWNSRYNLGTHVDKTPASDR